ncbi:MAG: hypothetical protein AVDCRST_MAG88-2362, partial [uncultured Thermomicrobiales bacterium]
WQSRRSAPPARSPAHRRSCPRRPPCRRASAPGC